jgi:2-polyprenyl-6-methoxyphenol hydroxylase-like FAD-dependent oxidoreductase
LTLDRDELPAAPVPRVGAPQGNHLHGLLHGGFLALESLFPGFEQDLIAAGAVRCGASLDIRQEFPGIDPMPQRDLGFAVYTASRPLIEQLIRKRVERRSNLTFSPGCRVTSISRSEQGQVDGVRYGRNETIRGDLVVDASARGALTMSLLRESGFEPEETRMGIDVSYATTIFRIPEGQRDWKMVMTVPKSPDDSKAGYIFPIEGGRWMALISDRHNPTPLAENDDFLGLARELRTSTIYDALKSAQRLDRVRRYKVEESSWRHYERMAEFPQRLIPVGDAICQFNPVWAQGMTVALKEACILGDLLRTRREPGLAGLGHAFLEKARPLLECAWDLSSIPDFAHPKTRGEAPADLQERLQFNTALIQLAASDIEVHRLVQSVFALAEPADALQNPDLVRRVKMQMAAG